MLTPEELARASLEHESLYGMFVWQDDGKTFGIPERWGRPVLEHGVLVGDCDDWAMEMDVRLGFIDIRLRRFAVCRTNRLIKTFDHCVLVLVDGKTLWVSDCNSKNLKKITTLPYDRWAWSAAGGKIDDDWSAIPLEDYPG